MILESYIESVKSEIERTLAQKPTISVGHCLPDKIPLLGQRWTQIDSVSVVYADMVGSSTIDFQSHPRTSASIYELFTGGLVDAMWAFGSEYVDVQGDGVLAIFVERGNIGRAFLAAVSFLTACETSIQPAVIDLTKGRIDVKCRVGLSSGPTIVKRIGRRGGFNKEVWAYRTVNEAVKLCATATPKHLVVSAKAFSDLCTCDEIARSCGCVVDPENRQSIKDSGGPRRDLWEQVAAEQLGTSGIAEAWQLKSIWCPVHGGATLNCIAKHYGVSFPRIIAES